jgi:tetratricopeptide (TPR) repeat protein
MSDDLIAVGSGSDGPPVSASDIAPGSASATTTDPAGPPLSGVVLDELWDFGNPSASAERFSERLAANTDGALAAAELRTQFARALGLQGRFDEADGVLDEVSKFGDEVRPTPPILGARLALERGRVLNSSGSPTQAVAEFELALELANVAGDDFLAADAAHMLAIADREHADDWTRRGLEIVDGSSGVRTLRWAGSLHNNLGWSLHDSSRYDEALEQFNAALEAYRSAGTPEQGRIARWAVARCLRSLKRYDEAIAIQTDLSAGPSDGYVDEELGELLLATGRTAESVPHFAVAAEALGADEWLAEHEPERIARLRELGVSAGRGGPAPERP